MTHQRARHLEVLLRETIGFSPITGLFGHRQVGKTTLVAKLARQYVTLDDSAQLSLAEAQPELFIQNRKHPFGIDESQLSPALFPALKEHVRVDRKPGSFLITGSVRFSSRRQIRESLAGRIVSWELLPMDLAEIHEAPLRDSLLRLVSGKSLEIGLKASQYFEPKSVERYIHFGGLPGLFSVRNSRIRAQKLELQIETILERDLRMVVESKLTYATLRNLLTVMADAQGEPFEIYEISRKSQVSVPTLMRLLRGLEAMFLIRFLPTEGTSRKTVLMFEDQGEATFLATRAYGRIFDLVRFLYANLRTQCAYDSKRVGRIYQQRNRGGAHIPLVVEFKGHPPLGIVPILEERPTKQALGSALSFVKEKRGRVVFPHLGKADSLIHPSIRILPVSHLI